jgi:hypothetical protein
LSKIKIRFNTKNTDGFLPWRVFIDDQEFLASEIKILGEAVGEKSIENGVIKWNISCYGDVKWQGNEAIVVSKDEV